jgi:hypothetical protein
MMCVEKLENRFQHGDHRDTEITERDFGSDSNPMRKILEKSAYVFAFLCVLRVSVSSVLKALTFPSSSLSWSES